MDELRELVRIVSKNKVKKIEIVGSQSNYYSNLQRLYEGIQSGRFHSDIEAEESLFPKDPGQKAKLKRLKNRLQNRLINTLFFIDVNLPKFNDSQKAYYTCYKDFAAVKILLGRSEKKNAIKIAKRILRKSLDCEFTELSVSVLKILRDHYGTYEGNWKKFKESNQLLKEKLEMMRMELMAEEYYIDLSRHFVKSNATKGELLETAELYSNDLKKHFPQKTTQRFDLMAYTVFAMKAQIETDYKATLKICRTALAVLGKRGSKINKTFLLTFIIKIISCEIQLRNFMAGEKAIMEAESLVEKSSINWFFIKGLHLILLFHTNNLQKTWGIYKQAINSPSFKNLPAAQIDQWKIYEAFIHYFIATDKIDTGFEEQNKIGKFRIGKFLNEMPVYSKDKRGANIQILILHILFLVHNKKYNETNKRLQALKSYSHRYLKKDETFRSNCFIHMLMQLPNAYYNKKATIRKAKKYRDKLSAVPLEVANQSADIEIVPYELLWDSVLSSLKG